MLLELPGFAKPKSEGDGMASMDNGKATGHNAPDALN
jgi:hypothetical protein